MSVNRKDISQISQYLKGRLDNQSMHELEHTAQDDLFLTDALEGYELTAKTPDQDMAVLEKKLAVRVANKRRNAIVLWRVLPIAACLLLMLGGGYWFFRRQPVTVQTVSVVTPAVLPKIEHKDSLLAAQPVPARHYRQKQIIKHLLKRNTITAITVKKEIKLSAPPAVVLQPQRPQYRPIAPVEQLVQGKIAKPGSGALARDTLMSKKISQPRFQFFGSRVQDNPVRNEETLLQGKLTDLSVSNNTGAPGLRGSVNIRGLLFVPNVDTVPKPVQDKVIRGYVVSKKTTDGKSYIISGKEVPDNPVGNVEQLLQGKVARLNIKNTGTPDVRGTVNIRGLPIVKEPVAVSVPTGYHLIIGRVIDSVGRSMVGATIGLFGIGIGQSDSYGEFHVAVPPKGEFYVTIAGYKARMVEIDKTKNYIVRLYQDKTAPNQSVVRGYKPGNEPIGQSNQGVIKKVKVTPRASGDTVCHENIKFRDRFFGCIGIMLKRDFEESNGLPVTVSDRQYRNAQKFLARYIDLNQSVYEWHNWYNVNKCNNLK